MTTPALYEIFLEHPLISTDTRKITASSLFFALKGDKFDANTFAQQAIEAGAAYAVIDNPTYQSGEKCILVDDVLLALQDLARYHRSQLGIPVIGLTGTNGKTTTKELINAVLSQRFKTLATQGNLNNHIGVPLTILSINDSHEMAVIEMGANHKKEIELLCTIAQPSHGLITNVGKAHLEGFGGFEGVKKGKGELYNYLKANRDILFINGDDADLQQMKNERDIEGAISYGSHYNFDFVSGAITGNSPYLELSWRRYNSTESQQLHTQVTGAYNFYNALAAICIGAYFGLTDDEIKNGVEGYQPKNNRSQIVQTATNTLICDYYNANPSSMAVAIENIGKMDAARKVLILGDMFELGDESAEEHASVIKKAMETDADERIFIGKEFYEAEATMVHGPWSMDKKTAYYPTAEDAMTALKAHPIKNATVLIKGSRGMALERLVELF